MVSLELMGMLSHVRTMQSKEAVAEYRLIRSMHVCRHAAELSPGPPAGGIARTGRHHAASVEIIQISMTPTTSEVKERNSHQQVKASKSQQ